MSRRCARSESCHGRAAASHAVSLVKPARAAVRMSAACAEGTGVTAHASMRLAGTPYRCRRSKQRLRRRRPRSSSNAVGKPFEPSANGAPAAVSEARSVASHGMNVAGAPPNGGACVLSAAMMSASTVAFCAPFARASVKMV